MSTQRRRQQVGGSELATASRKVVRCRRCGVPVTHALAELTDLSLLSGQDGAPYLPRGWFTISHPENQYGPVGEILANLGDLTHTAPHPNRRRRNGCCGVDGCDGMNTVCYEGHEVGTECSDCWMAHAIRFDPACVTLCEQENPLGARVARVWLAWQGRLIRALGKAIRAERRLTDLPVLADALEEAGCTDEAILNHCRQPGVHVKGCWVVDLLTSRR